MKFKSCKDFDIDYKNSLIFTEKDSENDKFYDNGEYTPLELFIIHRGDENNVEGFEMIRLSLKNSDDLFSLCIEGDKTISMLIVEAINHYLNDNY